jgi:hypothetical protein
VENIMPLFELKNLADGFHPEVKTVPIYNEFIANMSSIIKTRPEEFAELDYWIEKTPEAIGIINELTRDVVSSDIYFEAVQKTNAKEKIKKAEDFKEESNFIEEFSNTVRDFFIYGGGGFWHDEDMGVLKIRHLPMGVTDIKTDGRKITLFVENVSGKTPIEFNPENVVYGTFMKLKGKLYGFSPMIAALPEIQTIGYIKDYTKSFFKKGGTPDFLFSFAKEQAGSPNVGRLETQLKAYAHPSANRGHLVITGELTTERLNEFNKDMEFRQLATYLVGVIALGYNMPVAKVLQIVGRDIKGSATGTDAEKDAYYNHIKYFQTYWENLLNTQFWKPKFGVNMRFGSNYLQDEVREMQRNMVGADYLSKLNTIFSGYDKKVSDRYIMRLLNLKDEDVETGAIEIEMPYPNDRQGFAPDKKIEKGDTGQAYSKEKQKQQQNSSQASK